MKILDTLAELSREFGTPAYVSGGGGNTSVKEEETLWIKPSGTTLAGMTAERFVALDRERVRELYDLAPPADPVAREAAVKQLMMDSVRPESAGRPSVESPVHEAFDAAFVVHTHPAPVNALTCARDGAEACRELFPEALWVEYTDPGYTLAMAMRRSVNEYAEANGQQPLIVLIQNHGIFVAADTPEEIREAYAHVMETLSDVYGKAGLERDLVMRVAATEARAARIESMIRDVWPSEAEWTVLDSPPFTVPEGPLSPDHIVYMKSFPFLGDPTADAVEAFERTHGYLPRIIATNGGVYAVAKTPKKAALALDLARDGGLIRQLSEAFGGVRYLPDEARDFIENWEVESYRQKVAEA